MKKLRADSLPKFEPGWTYLGTGYHLDHPDRLIPLRIPDNDRKSHFWCFGTTRVGKTRMMESIIEQDIAKGYNVVVLDPKGDGALFSKIVEVAFLNKRLQDLMLFTPIFPEHSVELDPLRYFAMPEELVAHITSGVAVGKEPYFMNVAYEIALIIVQALLMLAAAHGESPRFNLDEIRKYIPKESLEGLRQQIDYLGERMPMAKVLSRTMAGILEKPTDYFAKISSSLTVALNELCEGNIGLVLGRSRENRFIQRLEEGKRVILVAQLGSMLTKRAAYTAGKVILSTIQTFVGRKFATGQSVTPPMCVHMDEAQNVLYLTIDTLFAQAGGAGVWLHGYCQSVNQLFAEIQEERGRTILDNCNTRLYMRVSDSDTALFVSEHLGEKRQYLAMIGMGTHNISLRDAIEERVRPHEVLTLAQREFYLTGYSGMYRGKTRDVRESRVEIVFPSIQADIGEESEDEEVEA